VGWDKRAKPILFAAVLVLVVLAAFLGGRDSTGESIHWAAWATSLGALAAAVGVFFVWRSVEEAEDSRKETEKTRHATTAADISRRWDEPEMRSSRELIRRLDREQRLRAALVIGLHKAATNDDMKTYTELQIVPNYLEDVVILLGLGALDREFVEGSLGAVIRSQWAVVRDAANGYAEAASKLGRSDLDPWPNLRLYCDGRPWKP
jgi:hypothetical protein